MGLSHAPYIDSASAFKVVTCFLSLRTGGLKLLENMERGGMCGSDPPENRAQHCAVQSSAPRHALLRIQRPARLLAEDLSDEAEEGGHSRAAADDFDGCNLLLPEAGGCECLHNKGIQSVHHNLRHSSYSVLKSCLTVVSSLSEGCLRILSWSSGCQAMTLEMGEIADPPKRQPVNLNGL